MLVEKWSLLEILDIFCILDNKNLKNNVASVVGFEMESANREQQQQTLVEK